MISRDQVYALLALRKRADGVFRPNPNGSTALNLDTIRLISDMHEGPEAAINVALRLAASGTTDDINALVKMVNENPDLLLQTGYVTTRCGIRISRVTLYEFFLGEGDPAGVKSIEFGFAKIPNGEKHRCRQYARYQPHIEALALQIETKQPAYDLRPLIEILKNSSQADTTAALNNDMTHENQLQSAMRAFRSAVKPSNAIIKPGMHYQHYITFLQAVSLLSSEWIELSYKNKNFDKTNFIWWQILKYLQLSLPAIDRFACARGLDDSKRIVNYVLPGTTGSFPDVSFDVEDSLASLAVSIAPTLFGNQTLFSPRSTRVPVSISNNWQRHVKIKTFCLQALRSIDNDLPLAIETIKTVSYSSPNVSNEEFRAIPNPLMKRFGLSS